MNRKNVIRETLKGLGSNLGGMKGNPKGPVSKNLKVQPHASLYPGGRKVPGVDQPFVTQSQPIARRPGGTSSVSSILAGDEAALAEYGAKAGTSPKPGAASYPVPPAISPKPDAPVVGAPIPAPWQNLPLRRLRRRMKKSPR